MAIANSINTPNPVGQSGSQIYAPDTGAANAYVVTLAPVPLAYADGNMVNFKALNTNTLASTINVNALGVKAIVRGDGTPLQANDIVAGRVYTVIYDGVSFQLASGSGGGASTSDFTQSFLLGGM
jgi:hypothetical protein